MSDAVYAKSIIEEIWPLEVYGRKSVITEAFEAVKRFQRSLPVEVVRARKRKWTERRIRSIVDDEEPALLRFEIADLENMAVREGRAAYAKSIDRAARIARFLAHADEDFSGPQVAAGLAMVRGLAGPGIGLAADGPNAAGQAAYRPGELGSGTAGAGAGK